MQPAARQLVDGLLVNRPEFPPKSRAQRAQPQALPGSSVGIVGGILGGFLPGADTRRGRVQQVLQGFGEQLGPQRVQFGPHMAVAKGRADQRVQLGQHLFDGRQHRLQQPLAGHAAADLVVAYQAQAVEFRPCAARCRAAQRGVLHRLGRR